MKLIKKIIVWLTKVFNIQKEKSISLDGGGTKKKNVKVIGGSRSGGSVAPYSDETENSISMDEPEKLN